MKLITLTDNRLALVQADTMRPFEFEGGMIALIQAGADGLEAAKNRAAESAIQPLDLAEVAPPILQPSKIVAIGKNYAEHAKETNSPLPTTPIVFTKFTTSLVGYGAEVVWQDALTQEVDYEAELAVVIGKTARYVSEADALSYVFGYTCANDVTARDLQFGDGQWVRGKSLDTFCPLGPFLVTADEIPDPQTLDIRCYINEELRQNSNTQHMIFGVAFLISFLSHAFTLLPGDILLTGTPDGVGKFRNPPLFLKNGNEMVVEIDGVGRLVNRCRVG